MLSFSQTYGKVQMKLLEKRPLRNTKQCKFSVGFGMFLTVVCFSAVMLSYFPEDEEYPNKTGYAEASTSLSILSSHYPCQSSY